MANTAALDSARAFIEESLFDKGIPGDQVAPLIVGLAWTREHPDALQTGRTIIHPSCETVGEIIEVSNGMVGVNFNGERKDFPITEVASSFAAKLAAEKLTLFNGSEALALGRIEEESAVLIQG